MLDGTRRQNSRREADEMNNWRRWPRGLRIGPDGSERNRKQAPKAPDGLAANGTRSGTDPRPPGAPRAAVGGSSPLRPSVHSSHPQPATQSCSCRTCTCTSPSSSHHFRPIPFVVVLSSSSIHTLPLTLLLASLHLASPSHIPIPTDRSRYPNNRLSKLSLGLPIDPALHRQSPATATTTTTTSSSRCSHAHRNLIFALLASTHLSATGPSQPRPRPSMLL
jgi:hypothetical protein